VADIDALIKKYARNWSFERLSLVAMAILRISICAMLFYPDIPVVVTINEGIELGKIYGGENSGQFINGILDSIKNSEIRREDSKIGEPGEIK
jgi:transcription antitermination factor NusB